MARTARIFGITTDLSGSIGTGLIANNFTKNNTVESAEARDEKGKLLDLAAYSQSEDLSIDGLFVGSGIEVGSKITIGGKDYLVTSTSKTESNTAFQTASVSCKGGDDETVIHALSSIQA